MLNTVRKFTRSDLFTTVIFPLFVAGAWAAGRTFYSADLDKVIEDPGIFFSTLRTAFMVGVLVFLKAKGPDLMARFLGGRPPEQTLQTAVDEKTGVTVSMTPDAVQQVAKDAGVEAPKVSDVMRPPTP